MYTAICRHLYLPALYLIRRAPVAAAYRAALRDQRLSPEAMRALQVRRLRRLLRHAADHTPHYRKVFAERGFVPDAVARQEDIRALPILEKDDVRQHGTSMRADQFHGRVFHSATSGSTGLSLHLYIDSEHVAMVAAVARRGRSWWGLYPGDRELLLLGHPVGASADNERRRRIKYRFRNIVEFDTFRDLTRERALEIVAALRQWRPKVIYGYGSGIGRLAVRLQEQGIHLAEAERPVLVEYTADHMFENERVAAEAVFGAPVVSAYGARECGGMASVCPSGKMHWAADHALCEIVRPDGTPAGEGEVGDLVVTPLDNFAMPFLRYRIGDRLSFSNEVCDCGVTLPLVQLHAGRASEMITTSARSAVSSVVFDFINRNDLVHAGVRGVRQFLVEQTGLDDFVLHVVRDDPFDPRSVEIFVEQTKRALGDSVRVRVEFVPDIPMEPTGKRRWFKKSFTTGPATPAPSPVPEGAIP